MSNEKNDAAVEGFTRAGCTLALMPLLVVVFAPVDLLMMAYRGWAFAYAWRLLVVPTAGLPPLTTAAGMAMCVVYTVLHGPVIRFKGQSIDWRGYVIAHAFHPIAWVVTAHLAVWWFGVGAA